MRAFACLIAALTSLLLLASPAKTGETAQSPVGSWQSVDLVENIESFKPDKKSWRGELFLKEFEFLDGGKTSLSLRWENDWLLHEDGKTKAQYYIRQMSDTTYLFLPWLSDDVTTRGQKPWYYVLKKVSDKPSGKEQKDTSKPRGAFRPIEPVDSIKEFDDVRDRDLSKLRPAAIIPVISTLDFNKDTIWPDQNLPPAKRPEKLLEEAMNPGLGVRALHRRGITGKGVNVAIIDQAMYSDHPEFVGKIAAYHDLAGGRKSSMHGPSVTSLLVGNNCGTAPDATVYYVAARDMVFEVDYVEGLDWIIEQNSKLPPSEKIRVVSVSAAPGISGTPSSDNQKKWNNAMSRAENAGILVLDCTNYHGFILRCFLNPANREDPSLCSSDIRRDQKFDSKNDMLFAPSGPRTIAEQYQKDRFTYQYNAKGGQSWAVPYVAGVLAMGWQVNPGLGPEQMKEILFNSAAKGKNGEKIIDPQRFIGMVRAAKPKSVSNY